MFGKTPPRIDFQVCTGVLKHVLPLLSHLTVFPALSCKGTKTIAEHIKHGCMSQVTRCRQQIRTVHRSSATCSRRQMRPAANSARRSRFSLKKSLKLRRPMRLRSDSTSSCVAPASPCAATCMSSSSAGGIIDSRSQQSINGRRATAMLHFFCMGI